MLLRIVICIWIGTFFILHKNKKYGSLSWIFTRLIDAKNHDAHWTSLVGTWSQRVKYLMLRLTFVLRCTRLIHFKASNTNFWLLNLKRKLRRKRTYACAEKYASRQATLHRILAVASIMIIIHVVGIHCFSDK